MKHPFITTITEITVHHQDENPIYGESALKVRLQDEAAGCFIVLAQHADLAAKMGEVRLSPEELPIVMQTAKRLLDQPGAKDQP